jgi:hypothetical protein
VLNRLNGELEIYKKIADILTQNFKSQQILSCAAINPGEEHPEAPSDFKFKLVITTQEKQFTLYCPSANE